MITDCFRKNSDVISKDDDDTGHTDTVTHKSCLTDNQPVSQPYRRIPPSHIDEVRQHIRKLLENGVIRESKSPFPSPIALVRKKRQLFKIVCRLSKAQC